VFGRGFELFILEGNEDVYLFIYFFFGGGGGAWTRRLHSRVGANMQSVLISLFADVISS
jgi:hypothetical protein